MKLKHLYGKQVENSLIFCVCVLWPFRVSFTLGEPVKSDAPAAPNLDSDATRVVYDQRQTGKYNIHLSIKDVAIIEMDQNEIEDMNYGEDDYYYDEGHLTVKPILLKPISALNEPNQTTSSTIATTTSLTTSHQEQISTTSNILNNQTSYSPNLIADIAATHAANSDHIELNVTSALPTTTTKTETMRATQNFVIFDDQSSTHKSPTSTHKPATSTTLRPAESSARSKYTPTHSSLQEPLLHPRTHLNAPRLPPRPYFRFIDAADANTGEKNLNQQESDHKNDSRIFKFKVRRGYRGGYPAVGNGEPLPYPNPLSMHRTCRANQFRDINGNCRSKRSMSLLKKLFSMLITLPFSNERGMGDHEDE